MSRVGKPDDTLVDPPTLKVAASTPAVAEQEARRRKPSHGVFLILLLLFTLASLGHVAIHLQHLDVALALGQARKQQASLRERKRKLELEIGVLKDPERVLSIARERLALRPPAVNDIVAMDELGQRVSEVLSAGEGGEAGDARDGAQ